MKNKHEKETPDLKHFGPKVRCYNNFGKVGCKKMAKWYCSCGGKWCDECSDNGQQCSDDIDPHMMEKRND